MPGTELSGRHRLELAILCGEAERDGDHMRATLVLLIEYARKEGLAPGMFSPRDEQELPLAANAVDLLHHPDDFPPGSLGRHVLEVAGIRPGP